MEIRERVLFCKFEVNSDVFLRIVSEIFKLVVLFWVSVCFLSFFVSLEGKILMRNRKIFVEVKVFSKSWREIFYVLRLVFCFYFS